MTTTATATSTSTSKLTITEHTGGYADRTRYNANYADLTVAFAINFDTPGERLTLSAAGDKYVGIPFEQYRMIGDVFGVADLILMEMGTRDNVRVVNIAGNGIYTLVKQGIYQEDIDDFLFDVLAIVHSQHTIAEVVTGGQTGVDIAGAVAAMAVGIGKVTVVMAEGYMQRLVDGKDVCGDFACLNLPDVQEHAQC
jgi:hypothetical protein